MEPQPENRTCVAILNYNNAPLTLRCLESVLQQEGASFLPVITDNGSTDDSIRQLIRYFEEHRYTYVILDNGTLAPAGSGTSPDVILLQTGKNGGFSYGNNVSLEFAGLYGGFTHILLLNNDVVLEKGFLSALVLRHQHLSDQYPGKPVGLGATETDPEGNLRHSGIHYLHVLTGLVFPRPVFPAFGYLVGASLFLPVDAPRFDEDYFLYYDDTAYSKILLGKKYILDTCSSAVYRHDIGSTTRSNPDLHKVIFTSMRRFYREYYPAAYPIVIALRLMLELIRFRFRIGADLLFSAFGKVWKN